MRYEAQTYMTPKEVLEEAISFFGIDLGLALQSQGPARFHFVGGGGHVTISVRDGVPVAVDFEAREWDAQVEAFMAQITRKRWWRRFWKGVQQERG
ncbi:MAG: hypothetical protein HYZ81_10465 [Nitrospinae bacterium]|nr:hypothetical protein [Nitrospinota bacterium]